VRAGLVVYGSLDVVSGGNVYDQKLVEALRRRGHDVDVISIPGKSYAFHLTQNLSPLLRRRILEARPEVILEDELCHPSLFHLNRSLRNSAPIVSIVHHLRSSEDRPGWQNHWYRKVEKRFLRTVDAFVFNSHTTRETVEWVLSEKTKNVVATPGGDRLERSIGRDDVFRRARDGGALRILFVGNLIPRKGLHVLLEALASIREREFELDVVGSETMDRTYAAGIREKVRGLGFENRVRFHGSLDGARLADRFREAQAFVVPSSYEGFGIVYLEAMGFGLPVIASASGATDEIVQHETTGFLVPPGDSWSLARRIESLIEDRDLLGRLSLTALEAFDAHPRWDASMGRVEEFLRALTHA
jgi:glycosyltransferase involved in cell wall biosynthesis